MTHPRNGALVRGRRGLALSAAALLPAVAALAPPAVAGVAETPNACAFSYDGEYRTQGVEITASAPASAAAGQAFTLAGEELEVKLRAELARDAAAVGLIPSDGSPVSIGTRTWIALKGTNTREGTQVIGPVSVTASTSALYDESSQTISATPFVYTPPKLPDTTWTGTGGDIAFSQAGADAITAAKGQLPVGGGGSAVTVRGSAVVQANLPGGANFYMDCQPGETNVTRPEAGAGTSFNPLVAAPFAAVQVAGAATNPGGAPPARSGGGGAGAGRAPAATTPRIAGRIASTRLAAKAGRVRVRVRCAAGGPACAGTVTLRTRTKVKLGSRRARVFSLVRGVRYSVAAGKAKTVTLRLGLDGKRLVARRRTQKVTLTLKPAKGKAAKRNLTLRRG
ncbi:MAG: hypothetical protein Q8K79_04370 [Solirubrobacteraceae bacterium]|nr:hypothetical protein [Solirubrobacteraceae bacterium]